jgi:hypothetical protein
VRGLTRGQKVVPLIVVTLFSLVHVSCGRVQPHYVLPKLAVADPSFLPSVDAYTSAALDGNTVDLLLDVHVFLLAMSSARRSIYITNPYFLPTSG